MCNFDNKIEVSETKVDSMSPWNFQVEQLQPDKKVVFAKVTSGSLYRSTDYGKTFTLQMLSPPPASSKVQFIGKTADYNSLFFIGESGAMWGTKNQGETYQQITYPSNLVRLSYCNGHPTQSLWLICWGDAFNATRSQDIWVTQDFGQNWKLLAKNTLSFRWAYLEEHPSWNPIDGIVYSGVADPSPSRDQYSHPYSDYNMFMVQLAKSDSRSVVLANTPFFWSDGKVAYALRNEVNKNGHLYLSRDNGRTWGSVAFPASLEATGWSLVADDPAGAVFMSSHGGLAGEGAPTWGDVYVSDQYDSDFSLALKNVRRSNWGHDFAPFDGLAGLYVANTYAAPSATNKDLQTKISFDMGGKWRRLRAPDASDECIGQRDCYLNLYGVGDSMFGRFYSWYDAIGLMIGVGNVGPALTYDIHNTYITRDGGVNWVQLKNYSTTYEFGDRGALLVAATIEAPTNTLLYSWDSGQRFVECQMTSLPFEVQNIIVSNSSSQDFWVHGVRKYANGTTEGVIVFVDFSGLNEAECTDDDYENWSPDDGSGAQCMLGQKITYRRRKPTAECYNPLAFDVMTRGPRCACTEEDYECDYCYTFDERSEKCVWSCPDRKEGLPPPDCPDFWYPHANGTRLVEGTKCRLDAPGAVNKLGPKSPCPGALTGGGSRIAIGVLLGIVLVVILGGAGYIVYSQNDGLKKWVEEKLNPTPNVFTLPESALENKAPSSAAGSKANADRITLKDNDEEDEEAK